MSDMGPQKVVFKEELKKLPPMVQQALNSLDWEDEIHAIAKKYKLMIDEADTLYGETVLVMLGLEDREDLRANIEDHVGTTEEDGENITKELNERVFKPINQKVRQISLEESVKEKKNKEILKKSGVEIGQEAPGASDAPKPDPSVPKPVQPKQKQAIHDIESPEMILPKTPPVNLATTKLEELFSIKSGETKHETIPAFTPKKSYGSPDSDPYLEPIE